MAVSGEMSGIRMTAADPSSATGTVTRKLDEEKARGGLACLVLVARSAEALIHVLVGKDHMNKGRK